MDREKTKLELARAIMALDNDALIQKIWDALQGERKDFWLELSPEEKADIQLGIEQVKRGEVISLEDFWKKVG